MSNVNNIYLFDIDGTISYNGEILPSTKIALKRLKEKGNLVMLATGRCLGQMEDILKEIDVDGAILNNGSYAILNKEEIFSSPIDPNKIYQMIKDGLNISALLKDRFVYFNEDPIFPIFCDYFKINMPTLVSNDVLNEEKTYSLGVYDKDCDSLDLEKYDLKYIRICKWGFDVINKGISKASAFKALKNKYPGAKIIAFGDNYNDLEMLTNADISVAMGNAPEDLKKKATYTTLHSKDGGIEYAVKEILKIYED